MTVSHCYFAKLQEYRVEIPNLISRRQYNDRRKTTSSLCNAIRERMVSEMDGGEDYFCIDSKPIEVCRIARSKRCSMGKKDFSKAPGVGYCASQSMYYYGYKLHAVCGLSGVIHSFDLTKASVHDIHYLKDVKVDYSNCTVIGDRGYISAKCNWICLKLPISDWRYHTDVTKKNGSQHSQLLPKREKELKHYSRNCVTSL